MSVAVPRTTTLSYREAVRRALREELLRDEDVFLMGEEIGIFEGSYKVTAGLFREFGPSSCATRTSSSWARRSGSSRAPTR